MFLFGDIVAAKCIAYNSSWIRTYRLVTFPSLPDLTFDASVLLGSGRSAGVPVDASLRIGSMMSM